MLHMHDRTLVWSAVVALLAFGITYLLFRVFPNIRSGATILPTAGTNLASLVVNILILLISLISIVIALAAYDNARTSGEEQRKTLDASRAALDSVVRVANKQQSLLDESLKVSSAHFQMVREQREEELARLRRRPKVDIRLGEIPSDQLLKNPMVAVDYSKVAHQRFDFVVRNVGDASVHKPTVLAVAQPPSVAVDEAGLHRDRPDKNVYVFTGIAVPDLLPYSIAEINYKYSVDVTVPPDVDAFDLTFKIYGENLDNKSITVRVNVSRGSAPK